LGDKAVVEHAMEALRQFPADRHVLLTDEESADELRHYATAHGFELFAGDRENVLARFAGAAEAYRVETVVRATADNPLVSPRVVRESYALLETYRCDFAAITGTPLGTGVELIRAEALRQALNGEPDAYEQEHVSPYLYRRPGRFRVMRAEAGRDIYLPSARVTLDTEEDYALLTQIYETLYRGRPVSIEELVPWLRQQDTTQRFAVRDSA
jgi:spore coat polysaccharide biosynthesis protein SpsF